MSDEASGRRRGRPPTVSMEAILAAAVELGFERLTIAAVAERLGVTRTSIHRFVGSREQLETLLGEHLIGTAQIPPGDGAPLEEYLLAFGRRISERVRSHPGLGSYYARGFPRTDATMQIVEDFVATLVARGIAPGPALRLAGGVAACAIGLADYAAERTERTHDSDPPDPATYPLVSAAEDAAENVPDDEPWWEWNADDDETSLGPIRTATPPASATPASASFPVTITHALGTATIPEKPERIVALSFEEDLLGLIDVDVVGHAENWDTPGELYPWQEGTVSREGSEAVTTLPDGNPALEKIAALDPDLILATNYVALPDYYDKLAAIAPTVGYEKEWGGATWQDNAAVIGQAIGENAAVADAVADLEGFLDGLAAEYPGLQGKHYAGAYHHARKQFAVNANPDGHAARVFGELGLTFDPELADAVQDNSLSFENIGLLDADLLVVSYASPELQEELESDPLFSGLDVVTDGRYRGQDNSEAFASNNPTVLNIRCLLERQRDLFAKVAGAQTPAATGAPTP